MQVHRELPDKISERLKDNPQGLSQLELLCQCRGYRYTRRKLLFFSVQERRLKQEYKFSEVAQLLKRVVNEADVAYAARVEKFKAGEEKKLKRQAKASLYELVEPPQEKVVSEASRELVSGSERYELYQTIKAISSAATSWGAITNDAVATLDAVIPDSFKEMFKDPNSLWAALGASERAEMSGLMTDFDSPSLELARDSMLGGVITSYSSDSDAARGIQGLAGIISEFQQQPQPPVYKEIPEQRERTAFALIDAELKQRLERYPKVVWQKLEVERQFREDEAIGREIMLMRQATRRALEALVKDGKVTRKGKLVDGIFYLSNESHD